MPAEGGYPRLRPRHQSRGWPHQPRRRRLDALCCGHDVGEGCALPSPPSCPPKAGIHDFDRGTKVVDGRISREDGVLTPCAAAMTWERAARFPLLRHARRRRVSTTSTEAPKSWMAASAAKTAS